MSPGTAQGSLGCKSTLLLSIHLARIWSPTFNQRLSKIFVHTVESAGVFLFCLLMSLSIKEPLQRPKLDGQKSFILVWHFHLLHGLSLQVLRNSDKYISTQGWGLVCSRTTLHLILNIWFWEALGAPVFQSEIWDSNEGRKEGRRTKKRREGEGKKQRVSGLSFTPKEVETYASSHSLSHMIFKLFI